LKVCRPVSALRSLAEKFVGTYLLCFHTLLSLAKSSLAVFYARLALEKSLGGRRSFFVFFDLWEVINIPCGDSLSEVFHYQERHNSGSVITVTRCKDIHGMAAITASTNMTFSF
jgi:hypothetical protein